MDAFKAKSVLSRQSWNFINMHQHSHHHLILLPPKFRGKLTIASMDLVDVSGDLIRGVDRVDTFGRKDSATRETPESVDTAEREGERGNRKEVLSKSHHRDDC